MMEIPTNRSVDARTIQVPETDSTAVRSVPLSYLFELAGAETLSLLKMDAEGAEYDAFFTAEPALLGRIKRIAMEYHDNLVPGTLAMLRQCLAPTHAITVLPDPGQLHGRLFAVRKGARGPDVSCHVKPAR